MKLNKNVGIIAGSAALLAVILVVTIVWASYSQTLTINGSATVERGAWDVHFENLQYVTDGSTINPHVDYADVITNPTIQNSTTIGDFSVKLKQPGDYVEYKFDVVNAGTFWAINDILTYKTPVCTKGANGTDADATNVCKNINFYMCYKESDSGPCIDYYDSNLTLPVLCDSGSSCPSTTTVYMIVEYDEATPANELPTDDVTVSNLGVTMNFVQEGME